jgi:hypothetical protein
MMEQQPLTTSDQRDYEAMTRQCKLLGCTERAYFQPVLLLSPDGERHKPLPLTGWLLCERHARTMDISDLVGRKGSEAWMHIQEIFAAKGYETPEWRHCQLAWRDA